MKTVVAIYDDFTVAQAAVRDLVQSGVARRNISLVTRDPDNTYARELEVLDAEGDRSLAAEGAGAGAITGGMVGGLGGLLVGLGALAIPGVGPIIAAGPIAAAIVGAGAGAVAGGIIGGLIGWGIPEHEAHYFAEGVRRGGTLVGVATPVEDVDLVTNTLNKYEPVDLEQRSTEWRTSGWSKFDVDTPPYTATTTADLTTTRGSYARSYGYPQKGAFDDVEYDDDDFDNYESSYRQHFDTTYGNRGFDYVDYQNAYRFGTQLGKDMRYTTYTDWADVEPAARQQWSKYYDRPWDAYSDAIQYGWNQMVYPIR